MRYGGKIFQTPEIRVQYYNQATLGGLCRQAYRNGVWHVLSLIANPASFKVRYFAPFGFVLWLVVFALAGLLHPLLWLGLALVAVCYIPFLAYVTIDIGRQHGWDLAPRVPLYVFAYHLAYGSGTFVGIARFVIGGREYRRRARAGSRIPDPAHPPQLGENAKSLEEIERLVSEKPR